MYRIELIIYMQLIKTKLRAAIMAVIKLTIEAAASGGRLANNGLEVCFIRRPDQIRLVSWFTVQVAEKLIPTSQLGNFFFTLNRLVDSADRLFRG